MQSWYSSWYIEKKFGGLEMLVFPVCVPLIEPARPQDRHCLSVFIVEVRGRHPLSQNVLVVELCSYLCGAFATLFPDTIPLKGSPTPISWSASLLALLLVFPVVGTA